MNTMHGIIFSYEKKTGLRELIEHRIHGSLPFAGDYRVVDFMLSNMVNAGVRDVGIIMHGKCQSLLNHLGSGKSWDLSRNYGGLTLLPAFAYAEHRENSGQFRGKMEALGCVRDYLRSIRQEYTVLADSDVVINLPLEDVLQRHIAAEADITAVCTSTLGGSQDVYFQLDDNGRIIDTAYDLFAPSGYRCLNLFVMKTELLLRLVDECMAHNRYSFQHHVLQDKVEELYLNAYVWDGYSAHIDTIQSYYQRSMEMLQPALREELFCSRRPIYAKENGSPSTYIDPDGVCVDSLIADGCNIQGSVKRCVVFRGVQVEKGADVENCILFKGTVVKKGAIMRHVITDKHVVISENRTLMGSENYPLVIGRDTEV